MNGVHQLWTWHGSVYVCLDERFAKQNTACMRIEPSHFTHWRAALGRTLKDFRRQADDAPVITT